MCHSDHLWPVRSDFYSDMLGKYGPSCIFLKPKLRGSQVFFPFHCMLHLLQLLSFYAMGMLFLTSQTMVETSMLAVSIM